jgi:hypothetical protein
VHTSAQPADSRLSRLTWRCAGRALCYVGLYLVKRRSERAEDGWTDWSIELASLSVPRSGLDDSKRKMALRALDERARRERAGRLASPLRPVRRRGQLACFASPFLCHQARWSVNSPPSTLVYLAGAELVRRAPTRLVWEKAAIPAGSSRAHPSLVNGPGYCGQAPLTAVTHHENHQFPGEQ